MTKEIDKDAVCYGTATIGAKGQFVVPVDARRRMGLEPGDKVLVFGRSDQILAVVKVDRITDLLTDLSQIVPQLKDLNNIEKE